MAPNPFVVHETGNSEPAEQASLPPHPGIGHRRPRIRTPISARRFVPIRVRVEAVVSLARDDKQVLQCVLCVRGYPAANALGVVSRHELRDSLNLQALDVQQFMQHIVGREDILGANKDRCLRWGYTDSKAIGIGGRWRPRTVVDFDRNFALCEAFDAVNERPRDSFACRAG